VHTGNFAQSDLSKQNIRLKPNFLQVSSDLIKLGLQPSTK